ncbi:MAG TPA: hypothetical protein PKG88_04475 [Bacteroidales bacterium]|jgi:hypothetical protein|nr:hypothetical protein [Bacteroidales bacterium]HPS70827.1 hypothetical protein [Bacteroidales bacterium]
MDDELIEKVKLILTEWNPLGDQASQIDDLDNYETEAIDILFYLNKKSSVEKINKVMVTVVSEAFGLLDDLEDTLQYAEKIKKALNE